LTLARKVKPDFVVAYASDPAAPVAAFISEKLGLPGNPYESVQILAEKDRFRTFQKEKGLNVPEFILLTENDNPDAKLRMLRYPFVVKPSDASGSKGVSKVSSLDEIDSAIKTAFAFSRNKQIIAEEFIDNDLADIHGDGFVVDGELVFSCLGDHIYNGKSNPYNPVGTLWPSKQPAFVIKEIEEEVAGIIKGTGIRNGPLNIEARVNSEGKHFIMEIGPRSGGNFVPQAILYATGFDMVKASLDVMEGKKILIPDQPRKCSAYYAIHPDYAGNLIHLSLSEKLKPFVREFHQYVQPGEKVKSFYEANAAIGIIILSFASLKEMSSVMNRINDLYSLKIV